MMLQSNTIKSSLKINVPNNVGLAISSRMKILLVKSAMRPAQLVIRVQLTVLLVKILLELYIIIWGPLAMPNAPTAIMEQILTISAMNVIQFVVNAMMGPTILVLPARKWTVQIIIFNTGQIRALRIAQMVNMPTIPP